MQIIWPKNFHFVSRARPEGIRVSPGFVATYANSIADLLKSQGVKPGDRVALWLSGGLDNVAAMLGCWMAGATFCILPSYAGRTDTERSQNRTENVLSVLRPKLLVQSPSSMLPEQITGPYETMVLTGVEEETVDTPFPATQVIAGSPDDMAFVQFTSGSTGGDARGAVVNFGQLKANLDSLAKRTAMSDRDCMVSWAPLYHDMGLMAVLLSLSCGSDLVLMETDVFVRRPSAWLEAISTFRGTVSTAPPTALKLLSRRKAKNVDLGSWRYAWIGGESVFPSVLDSFEHAYSPAGLAKGVLQPTYGMAETVVGISCGEPDSLWSVKDGVVSCGAPLDGMDFQVVKENGDPVAKGIEGRVMVRGPSVMKGYLDQPKFGENTWFETGDLGFYRNGLLFITGRIKDVLKRGAESFPAALIEVVAEDALGLRTGRVAAFANRRADLGKEEIVLLVESKDWDEQNARIVAAAVASEIGLQVDVIRNAQGGRLPRTSSGKLMRQQTAALYREGMV